MNGEQKMEDGKTKCKSSGYKYIIQGCCSLIYWPEWAMLPQENAVALGKWMTSFIIGAYY